MTTTTNIATTRRERFAAVLNAYDAEGPDGSIPGATSAPERYALLTESLRGHGHFAFYCATLGDVEQAAVANITDAWQPVCYFDLDTLAGDAPPATEGDVVEHDGRRCHVVHVEDDTSDGALFHWLYLHPRTSEPDGWIDDPLTQKVDECDCTILERTEPDLRMPVRYDAAKVQTSVVFNTIGADPLEMNR